MADRFGDSSDYSEQAIHFGGQDGGDISADRFGGSTQEMRFGNDGDENVTTTERSAYRRVKVSQAVARKERHLVRTNPSQLEQGGPVLYTIVSGLPVQRRIEDFDKGSVFAGVLPSDKSYIRDLEVAVIALELS